MDSNYSKPLIPNLYSKTVISILSFILHIMFLIFKLIDDN